MTRLELSASVETDLDEIAAFIAGDNPGRAVTFIQDIRAKFRVIQRTPLLYQLRPDIEEEARMAPATAVISLSNIDCSCAKGRYWRVWLRLARSSGTQRNGSRAVAQDHTRALRHCPCDGGALLLAKRLLSARISMAGESWSTLRLDRRLAIIGAGQQAVSEANMSSMCYRDWKCFAAMSQFRAGAA